MISFGVRVSKQKPWQFFHPCCVRGGRCFGADAWWETVADRRSTLCTTHLRHEGCRHGCVNQLHKPSNYKSKCIQNHLRYVWSFNSIRYEFWRLWKQTHANSFSNQEVRAILLEVWWTSYSHLHNVWRQDQDGYKRNKFFIPVWKQTMEACSHKSATPTPFKNNCRNR